jgi:hypothetical protein
MASSRPRDSIRASKGLSAKSNNHQRKPAPPKRSKLSTAREALRDAERIRGSRTAKRLRIKPRPPLEATAGTELYGIRRKLELIQSCAQVVGFALGEQNCDLDSDAARILSSHVTDALMDQIERIDRLLGRGEPTYKGIVEDGGAL